MTHKITVINTSNSESDLVKVVRASGDFTMLSRGENIDLGPEALSFERETDSSRDQSYRGGIDIFVGDEELQGTLGHTRIRPDFYPTEDVKRLKKIYAHLVNLVEQIEPVDGEQARIKALALTELESSAMWAVKALTYWTDPVDGKDA